MSRRRYVADTQLYIDALRQDKDRAGLNAFQMEQTPFLHLSAVVAQELRAGVRGTAAGRLEQDLIAPYERRGRLITPTDAAWKEAGRLLSELIPPSGRRAVTRSFANDVLLALSCREAGAVLVTSNVRDFARIAAAREFEFVRPGRKAPRYRKRREASQGSPLAFHSGRSDRVGQRREVEVAHAK